MRPRVYFCVTVDDRDDHAALSAAEESRTRCLWCPCSRRTESNFVFTNRKFLFSQLKMGNKKGLFWNGLSSFFYLMFLTHCPIPQRPRGPRFFLIKSSPRPHFPAEWASLGRLSYPHTRICLPSSTWSLALPSPSHRTDASRLASDAEGSSS